MFINKKDKILFIGDSITEDGRMEDSEGLGYGYVRIIRDLFSIRYPEYNVSFINRGISGNRVVDLRDRWDRDVLQENPDIVSISIGINDVWRQLDGGGIPVYIDEFEETYRGILEKTRDNTSARIILMETSIIEEDINSEGNRLLIPYNECIRSLAKDFDTLLVPINKVFVDYLEKADFLQMTTDGVHLSTLGRTLFATTWLNSVKY